MIEINEVKKIHDILIDKFGGTKGIRDNGLLESAIKRPYQTFDGKDLYQTPLDKAAAIFESIITNHPFIDGNKRTAYVLMRLMLRNYNLDIKTDQDEKYNFVMSAASGEVTFEQIKKWLQDHLKKDHIKQH